MEEAAEKVLGSHLPCSRQRVLQEALEDGNQQSWKFVGGVEAPIEMMTFKRLINERRAQSMLLCLDFP